MTVVGREESLVQFLQPQLSRLRGRLRGWVVVRGLGRWLAVVLAILVVDMGLDRLFRMDFSQRAVLWVVLVASIAYLAYRWCLRPAKQPVSDEALIDQIERKNPAARHWLIGGWQLEQDPRIAEKGWSEDLAAATVRRGRVEAAQVDYGRLLDGRGARRHGLVLAMALGAAGLLAWGVCSHDFFKNWFRRNLLLTNDQWPRQTHLVIEGAESGVLVIPRGADHRQLVHVTPDSVVAPDEVTLEVQTANGRMWHTMKATGRDAGREHAYIFHSVASEFRFRAAGGDAETDWVEVRLVEPPTLVEMTLDALLPDYTELTAQRLEGVGPHSVLQGSRLRVRAVANKPLAACELHIEEAVIELQATDESRTQFQITLPAATPNPAEGVASGKYQFHLLDQNQLANLREFSFTLRVREDQPPSVRGRLVGISGLVVPRATIPVALGITDDFGLSELSFDCQWIPPEEVAPTPSRRVPIASFARRDAVRELNETALLPLESLAIVPESSLRFVVAASDHQDPPLTGVSREFLLRVVTEEELRADLLRREIEQRRALQQAYDAQLDLIGEIRQLVAAPAEETAAVQQEAAVQNRLLTLLRAQRAVGNSLATIAGRFEEFLAEVRNNRLDEGLDEIAMGRSLTTRFAQEIARPLTIIDDQWVALAARSIEQCSRQLSDEVLFQEAAAQSIAAQEEVLNGIRQVLAAMEDSENYQDLINKLMEFKRIEDEIKQQLKRLESPDRILDRDQ